MIRLKQSIKKGFVRLVRQNPKDVTVSLPSAPCKGGEAKQQSLAAILNKERAT
jgi:hypothetical protein